MFIQIKLLKNILNLSQQSNAKTVIAQINQLIIFKQQHSKCKNGYSEMIQEIQKIKIQLQHNLNKQLTAKIKAQTPQIKIVQRSIIIQSKINSQKRQNHFKLGFDRCTSQAIYLPQTSKLVSFIQIERQSNRNTVDILQQQLNLSKKQNIRLQAQNKKLKERLQERKFKPTAQVQSLKSEVPNFKKNK